MRNIIPVVMAGVLGIYGLIVSVVSALHTTCPTRCTLHLNCLGSSLVAVIERGAVHLRIATASIVD
jgi:hypothetical protein